jgi:hypothetical protein
METARTVGGEWRKVLRVSVGREAKEDELSTGRFWAAGFHSVRDRYRVARVLKIMNRLFI